MLSFRTFGARFLFVLAAAALVLTGCSGGEGDAPVPSSSEQPVITGEPAGFDADDITFAFSTIAHHGQSIELAALVPDHSTNQDLITLAASVTAEQSPDVELMKAFLVQWNENPNNDAGQSSALTGIIDDATLARLKSSSGQEFDTLWLQSMIGHSQGAITMAEAEMAGGTNVDAIATAKRMVASQQAQIGSMQQLLGAG